MRVVQDGLLSSELEQLRQALACDFAAVAQMDRRENKIRWVCMSGNVSNRSQQMTKKPGSGLTGHVVRHGRPVVIDLKTPNLEQTRKSYPIMLAEQLACVIAVPLYQDDQIDGVLLVGNRQLQQYETRMVDQTIEAARMIADYL